mgnify:CR=1 FL=1
MMICPLLGCKEPRHRLNAINAAQFLWAGRDSHLLSHRAHRGNPAVAILIKRYEAAKADSQMTSQRLDALTGTVNPFTSEWMAENSAAVGSDGLRTIASLESKADLFNPDLSSNLARGTWKRQAKEEYKRFLDVERKAEREAARRKQRRRPLAHRMRARTQPWGWMMRSGAPTIRRSRSTQQRSLPNCAT